MVIHQETTFPSDTLICGNKGMGKSTKIKERCEWHFSRGDVCFDMLDFGRLENAFYYFPARNRRLKNLYAKRIKSVHPNAVLKDSWEPQGFPTDVYFPAVSGVNRRLPEIFRPFRISFSDLSFDELLILVGGHLTDYGKSLINLAWLHIEKQKNPTLDNLTKQVVGYAKKGHALIDGDKVPIADMRIATPLIRRLNDLQQTGILCDKDDPLALDLDKLMRDKSAIHSFTMRFLPRLEYAFLIYGWLCEKIYNLRMERHGYPELCMFFREIQKIAPSSPSFDGQHISTKYLRMLSSEGRDLQIRMFYDTQKPMKVHKEIREIPQVYHMFQLDRNDIEAFGKIFFIPDSVATATTRYKIGFCTTRNAMDDYKINANIIYMPPRSWCKEPEDDFIQIWKKLKLPLVKFKFTRPKGVMTITQIETKDEIPDAYVSTVAGQIKKVILTNNRAMSPVELLGVVDSTRTNIYPVLKLLRERDELILKNGKYSLPKE